MDFLYYLGSAPEQIMDWLNDFSFNKTIPQGFAYRLT
jgi:hypothetical protein